MGWSGVKVCSVVCVGGEGGGRGVSACVPILRLHFLYALTTLNTPETCGAGNNSSSAPINASFSKGCERQR